MSQPSSTEKSLFRFCPTCGAELLRVMVGDRVRARCGTCGYVQWRNPVVGVAAVISEDDVRAIFHDSAKWRGVEDSNGRFAPGAGPRLLLVRRAASFRGKWCLPCGYVEYDEEIREALRREIEEETGLLVRVETIVAVESNFHDPDKQSVGIWFRSVPIGGELRPGDDVDRIGFFPPTDPPELAFPTDAGVLRAIARGRVDPTGR